MRITPKNLSVWIVSVALAMLLWVHVVTNKLYEQTFTLPLRVTALPQGLMITSGVPDSCEIRVRGSGKALIRFSLEVKSLLVRANDYSSGTHVIDLEPKALQVGDIGAAEIIEVISPKKLRLKLEERSQKTLRVIPNLSASADTGAKHSAKVSVSPDSVMVWGPKRVLKRMESISTEALGPSIASRSFKERARLAFADSAYLILSDTFVVVTGELEQLANRVFSGIRVRSNNSRMHGVVLTPDTVSIVVEAPPGILDSMTSADFSVSVDDTKLQKGGGRVVPTVKLPHGVRLVELSPAEIRVEVRGE